MEAGRPRSARGGRPSWSQAETESPATPTRRPRVAPAALAYRWDGKRSRLYFQTYPGSYNAESLTAFLAELRRHFRSQRVILVWDGLPAHKSRIMKDYLQSQRRWLSEERLPGEAPDLNPVEMLWGNLKGQELANRCSEGVGEAASAVGRGMARVRQSQQLSFAFLHHAGLSF
jgi:putative transposase